MRMSAHPTFCVVMVLSHFNVHTGHCPLCRTVVCRLYFVIVSAYFAPLCMSDL